MKGLVFYTPLLNPFRKHVPQDLESHICTSSSCGLDTHRSQHALFEHELLIHRSRWVCPECSTDFLSSHDLKGHIGQHHHRLDTLVGSKAACYGGTGGHKAIVRLLLDQGAEINVQVGDYGSALRTASCHGHEIIVRAVAGSRSGSTCRADALATHCRPRYMHAETRLYSYCLLMASMLMPKAGTSKPHSRRRNGENL